jgi:hypothetical protein
LPPDFVSRCAAGIAGTPEEKRSAFTYLARLAASAPQAGVLIQAVQLAILGQDPALPGNTLSPEYARIWEEIRRSLSTRRRFFQDLEALLRYFEFANWDEVLSFMFKGLELDTG